MKTGNEDRYITNARALLSQKPDIPAVLMFPKRRLSVRRNGKNLTEVAPLFPGYVFLETRENGEKESTETIRKIYHTLRYVEGFYRFLKNNQDITSLGGKDLATLKHFIGFGEIAEASRVMFDETDRISVISGPLKGLEGQIVKVNRRKGRAKIKLDLYDDSFLLDLAFEVIEKNGDLQPEKGMTVNAAEQ